MTKAKSEITFAEYGKGGRDHQSEKRTVSYTLGMPRQKSPPPERHMERSDDTHSFTRKGGSGGREVAVNGGDCPHGGVWTRMR